MKFSWNSYWKPTPKDIRRFADALLAGAMTISAFSAFNDKPKLALTIMIVAGLAKFLSNFFAEDESAQP